MDELDPCPTVHQTKDKSIFELAMTSSITYMGFPQNEKKKKLEKDNF